MTARVELAPRAVAAQLGTGLLLVAAGWGSSLAGVEPVRRFWFDLVWVGYVLAGDAVVLARTGTSLLRSGGARVALLFLASAPFWWAFEIANWRLENWRYLGALDWPLAADVVAKSVAFALVLPALAVSRDLLRSLVRMPHPPPLRLPRAAGGWMVAAGALAVPLLYAFPDQAYPLLWVAPLLLLDGAADLAGRPSAVALLRAGRAGPVLLVAAAGLLTGALWELWNWGAQPHWEYRVPYVGAPRLFEMPLLGYGGYLPFALAADAFWRWVSGGWGGLAEQPATALGPGGQATVDTTQR